MAAAETFGNSGFGDFEARDEPGRGRAVGLAFAVHLVLLGILFVGVRWHSERPAPVMVELWQPPPQAIATPTPKSVPKVVPPPPPKPEPKVEPPKPLPVPKVETPPPPKPAPRIEKPDIVQKVPPKPKPPPKPVAEPKPAPKPKVEAKPKPKPRPDAAAQRAMRQELAREQATIRAQRQDAELRALLSRESSARALAAWTDKIRAKIHGNIILPPSLAGNPEAVFDVVLLPTGEVLGAPRLRRSSGDLRYDDAVLRAILKSSPLPRPADPKVFSRNLELRFRPQE